VHPRRDLVDEVLLEIRLAVFVASGPVVAMDDRIAPWEGGDTPLFEVVIFLDRAVEQAHRRGEHARSKA